MHHTNLCGPISVASIEGSFYVVLLKDNHNSFHLTYCFKHKNDILNFLKIIETLQENTIYLTIKMVEKNEMVMSINPFDQVIMLNKLILTWPS
jgi:hypothetical protein